MASALEEMGSFLAKHEHGGNSHAMEGHFSAAHKDGEPPKTAGVETLDSFGFNTLTAQTYSNLIMFILPYVRMLLSGVQLRYLFSGAAEDVRNTVYIYIICEIHDVWNLWNSASVTGSWIGSEGTSTSLSTLPASLQKKLSQLAVDLDAAQLEIVNALAAEIGPPQILGEHLDIPLLSEKPEPSSGWKYGLLDVVRYRMGAESPDEVVAPHADPGLLILSLPCSTPGSRLWCSLGR